MSIYKDMAHDAGYRGEEAEQMAQAIEQDHMRQAMEHQEQEPDQIDMMSEAELREALRTQITESRERLVSLTKAIEENTILSAEGKSAFMAGHRAGYSAGCANVPSGGRYVERDYEVWRKHASASGSQELSKCPDCGDKSYTPDGFCVSEHCKPDDSSHGGIQITICPHGVDLTLRDCRLCEKTTADSKQDSE